MAKRLEIILALIGIILTAIALLFGDNIYQQITGRSVYGNIQPLSSSEAIPTSGNPDSITPPESSIQASSTPLVLGDIIFDENFDNNNNSWPTGKSENNYEVYLDGGEYHVVGEPNGKWMWFGVKQITNLNDFYLEVKTRRLDDSQESNDYGMHFRQSNLVNYVFVINPDQQSYALLYVDRPTDQYTALIHWVYSPRISIGFETNTIGLLCDGDTITMYINGYHVDSIKNNASLSGAIGIVGGAGEHIAIDYLRIWALK